MVQRRHLEDTAAGSVFPLRIFKVERLEDNRQIFYQEYATEDGDEQFLADDYRKDGDDATQREAPRVAHEDLRGVGVVPQESDGRPDEGGGKNHQLLGSGDEHDIQERGKLEVRRHIGQDAQCHPDDGRAARRQAVQAVRQVGSVRHGGYDEYHHQDEDYPGGFFLVIACPRDELGVVEVVVLHEGDGRLGRFRFLRVELDFLDGVALADLHVLADNDVGTEEEDETHDETQTYLADDFEPSVHSLFVLLKYLDIVVGEAQGTEPHRRYHHQNKINIRQLGAQQDGDEDGDDDDDTTHRGRSLLAHLSLQAQVAYRLAYLEILQAVDDAPTDGRSDEKREDERQSGAERHVLEHAGARKIQLV